MLPRIRIHSEHKGPEAVMIDTNERAILSEINDSGRLAPLMLIRGFASPRTTLGSMSAFVVVTFAQMEMLLLQSDKFRKL
jgi:hypothetical protein